MVELEPSAELPYGVLTSPYKRTTQSEIEIDCNCSDILNVFDRHDLQN